MTTTKTATSNRTRGVCRACRVKSAAAIFLVMVHAYQKGDLKNPSGKVKDVAGSISSDDAKDFAETKHKGLPMKKEEKKAAMQKLANLVTNCVLLSNAGIIKSALGPNLNPGGGVGGIGGVGGGGGGGGGGSAGSSGSNSVSTPSQLGGGTSRPAPQLRPVNVAPTPGIGSLRGLLSSLRGRNAGTTATSRRARSDSSRE